MNKSKKPPSYARIIDAMAGKKIAVWGDFILDEYIYGTTRRISREAPVLILSYSNSLYALGGAGNTLMNIRSLGGEPLPVGVLGDDESARQVLDLMHREHICTDHLCTLKGYQTPLKTRILAGEQSTRKQQILRIDRESIVPDSPDVTKALYASLRKLSRQAKALLISDYHYFTVTRDLFKEVKILYDDSRIPITLDSRFRILDFPGITVATPNESEVEEALNIQLGDNQEWINKAGRTLLNKCQAEALVMTQGSRGMLLFERRTPPFPIPIHGSPDIVDVTGAGDTVISTLTLGLTCGISFREAAHLANYAAGLVVMKKGTATVSSRELKKAVAEDCE
ncbi:MAG: hypothetical protein KJ874_09130 [Acidobacteria bacterium]|nr:hypothetical protein [Acidobacteriota bacterium]